MITLNLISPLQKKELRLLRVFIVIKNVIIYLLLFLILAAMVLLLSKMILQNNFNKIVADYNLNTRTGQIFSQDIKRFNQKLKTIQLIQADYVSWSEFLVDLTNLTPDEILLHTITIDKNTENIQISGRAKTRQALLDLQKNLQTVGCFESICIEKVEIPLSSLLEKENIDFTIESKLIIGKNQ